MKVGLIIIFCFYLFKLFQNRSREKREYQEAEHEIFNKVELILGTEGLKLLKSKTIWKGMPECLIYYILGQPVEIEEREVPDYINKTWFYSPIPNARSNAKEKYYMEIYTENGLVTSWKKINKK